MPLTRRREIDTTDIVGLRVECHGHHGPIFVIRYANTWDDGVVDTWESRIPLSDVQLIESKGQEVKELPVLHGWKLNMPES